MPGRHAAEKEPVTLRRLRSIRPRQEIVYYCGWLAIDIEESRVDAPGYASLLKRVANLALELQAAGKVRLIEREIRRETYHGLSIRMTEYSAVGLP
jgi:hypothetical protein